MLNHFEKHIYKLKSIPGLAPRIEGWLKHKRQHFTDEELQLFRKAQTLNEEVLKESSLFIQPGMSEVEAAQLIKEKFYSRGIKNFFHEPFAWFGARSCFEGFQSYKDFMPKADVNFREGDSFILDAAPVVNGVIVDGGVAFDNSNSPEFLKAQSFLLELRSEIPSKVLELKKASLVWRWVHHKITQAGYRNCHQDYPFSVLGHRVYFSDPKLQVSFMRFGLGSAYHLLTEGLFGEILTPESNFELEGLWAIEPHIGLFGLGLKFEELLVVQDGKCFWLKDQS